jgi:hypothetical protein
MSGLISDPVLIFGWQEIIIRESLITVNPRRLAQRMKSLLKYSGKIGLIKQRLGQEKSLRRIGFRLPDQFRAQTFSEVVKRYGATSVMVLDYLDPRADIQHDMNMPIPQEHYERFGTLIDIGCLEHVFDTAQCLENCMRMVRTYGHFVLHTTVNGFFNHGFHVFNPDALVSAFRVNGFTVLRQHFSDEAGKVVPDPSVPTNVIAWLVARKDRPMQKFVCPQQEKWDAYVTTGKTHQSRSRQLIK